MQKLLLVSILIMSVFIPVKMSNDKNRKKAIRNTVVLFLAYSLFYLFGLLYIYPRLEGM